MFSESGDLGYRIIRMFAIILIIFFFPLQAAALIPCIMIFDLMFPHLGSAVSFSLLPLCSWHMASFHSSFWLWSRWW